MGEHYCCIMQLNSNTARIEGKLSFHQEDPFQFVTSQGEKYAFAYVQCKVELSSPRKECTCTQRSKSWTSPSVFLFAVVYSLHLVLATCVY